MAPPATCVLVAACSAVLLGGASVVQARVVDFEKDAGAIADSKTNETAWHNGALLNATLPSLQPGDVLLVPNKTFFVMGGVVADNLRDVTVQIDGTVEYSDDMKEWPRTAGGHVLECLQIRNATNVTFTSSGKGVFQGNGATWWGIPGIGYLEREENRPRLFAIDRPRGVLIENIRFLQSPYWTFWATNADGLEVRHCDIEARRTEADTHDVVDMTAFNTDGFDVTGNNVWIHDVNVWNQDDCIAVKDGSTNMLFERINASGLGLTIGSIANSVVRNITFRDCYMKNTFKGIYLKFRNWTNQSAHGIIADVLYENIVMDAPEQYAIWIGPAQQSDSRDVCAAHPCSLCWPELPSAQCNFPSSARYSNLTFRNITINNPKQSPGVIRASAAAPIDGIVFDNVVVNNIPEHAKPFGENYNCDGVTHGVATGGTSPVPPCFEDRTH